MEENWEQDRWSPRKNTQTTAAAQAYEVKTHGKIHIVSLFLKHPLSLNPLLISSEPSPPEFLTVISPRERKKSAQNHLIMENYTCLNKRPPFETTVLA